MKTYAELEREAYMAGNTEMAKLYAEVEDCEAEIERLEDTRWDYDE